MKRNTKDRRKTVTAFVADEPEPKADKKLCSKKERRSKKDAIYQSILDWSAGMDEDLIDSPNGLCDVCGSIILDAEPGHAVAVAIREANKLAGRTVGQTA